MYHIYKICNNVTGDFYIGFTSRSPILRWTEHIKLCDIGRRGKLYSSMRKHGLDNFSFSIVESGNDINFGKNIREVELIKELHPSLNMTLGGDGVVGHSPSMDTRKKISESLRGKQKPKRSRSHSRNLARKLSHIWNITLPNGDNVEVLNLKEYCRQNNLNNGAMVQVAKGKLKHYKKHLCKKVM